MQDMITLRDTAYRDICDFGNILRTRLNIGMMAMGPFRYVFEFFSNTGLYYRGVVAFLPQGVLKTQVYDCHNKQVVMKTSRPGMLSSDTSLLNRIVRLIQK